VIGKARAFYRKGRKERKGVEIGSE
jgi:hypothetical protein